MDQVATSFCTQFLQAVESGSARGESRWTVLALPSSPDGNHKALAQRIAVLVQDAGFHCDLSRGPCYAQLERTAGYYLDLNQYAYVYRESQERIVDLETERYTLVVTSKCRKPDDEKRRAWVAARVSSLWPKLQGLASALRGSSSRILDLAPEGREQLGQHHVLWQRYNRDPELYHEGLGEAHWVRAPETEQALRNALDQRLRAESGQAMGLLWRVLPGCRLELRRQPSPLSLSERSDLAAAGWRGLASARDAACLQRC